MSNGERAFKTLLMRPMLYKMMVLKRPKWRKKTPPTQITPGTMAITVLLVRLTSSSLAISNKLVSLLTRSDHPSR